MLPPLIVQTYFRQGLKLKIFLLITGLTNQPTITNGDKTAKPADSTQDVLVSKTKLSSSKTSQMEKTGADVSESQFTGGTKSAPRLPPKPSMLTMCAKVCAYFFECIILVI